MAVPNKFEMKEDIFFLLQFFLLAKDKLVIFRQKIQEASIYFSWLCIFFFFWNIFLCLKIIESPCSFKIIGRPNIGSVKNNHDKWISYNMYVYTYFVSDPFFFWLLKICLNDDVLKTRAAPERIDNHCFHQVK